MNDSDSAAADPRFSDPSLSETEKLQKMFADLAGPIAQSLPLIDRQRITQLDSDFFGTEKWLGGVRFLQQQQQQQLSHQEDSQNMSLVLQEQHPPISQNGTHARRNCCGPIQLSWAVFLYHFVDYHSEIGSSVGENHLGILSSMMQTRFETALQLECFRSLQSLLEGQSPVAQRTEAKISTLPKIAQDCTGK